MSETVSRSELIEWLRATYHLDITQVQQCGNGAVYIQIIDSIHPGVPMQKVNWAAKQEYDMIRNYKVLQEVFDLCRISKKVDVHRLVKSRCQDNLEFLQWMKRYHDKNYVPNPDYDPVARREMGSMKGAEDWTRSIDGRDLNASFPSGSGRLNRLHSATRSSGGVESNRSTDKVTTCGSRPTTATARVIGPRTTMDRGASLQQQPKENEMLRELRRQLADVTEQLETARVERDFYFGKLRQLEVLSQEAGRKTMTVEEVQAVLYAEEESEEVGQEETT